MIQDINPYRYNVEYIKCEPRDDDRIILADSGSLLVLKCGQTIEHPQWKQIKNHDGIETEYLFAIEKDETPASAVAAAGTECDSAADRFAAGSSVADRSVAGNSDRQSCDAESERFFLVSAACNESSQNESSRIKMLAEELQNEGYSFITQREVQYYEPRREAFAGTTALQFADWYARTHFCGICGRPMKHDDRERMFYCEKCRVPVYPRINPVVIVGVIDGDRLLLTKYAHSTYKRYALVAGFVETGETLEDAVRREVFEETGIRVKNIRYYKSQPWPLSGSLIAGMFCDLDGSDQTTLNDGELSVAEWIKREDIPEYTDSVSITTEMILQFRNGNV